MLRRISTRLTSLFRRDRLERELDAELRFHIDMLTEQQVRAGYGAGRSAAQGAQAFGVVDAGEGRRAGYVDVAALRNARAGRALRTAESPP